MSRNDEFRNSALYHGTAHPFEIGDEITPQNMPHTFATTSLRTASRYALRRQRTGVPGQVFTVEPIDADEIVAGEPSSSGDVNVASRKGFRVTGTAELMQDALPSSAVRKA